MAKEATASGIDRRFMLCRQYRQRMLLKTLFKDELHCFVSGSIIKKQHSPTGGFKARLTVLFLELHDSLGCSKIVQHAIAEQVIDNPVACGPDRFGLPQAPLRILKLIGDGFRGQMLVHR